MRRRRRQDLPLPPFEFPYRGLLVQFSAADLDIAVDFNIEIFINGEPVALDREESMQFVRMYCAWLDSHV